MLSAPRHSPERRPDDESALKDSQTGQNGTSDKRGKLIQRHHDITPASGTG